MIAESGLISGTTYDTPIDPLATRGSNGECALREKIQQVRIGLSNPKGLAKNGVKNRNKTTCSAINEFTNSDREVCTLTIVRLRCIILTKKKGKNGAKALNADYHAFVSIVLCCGKCPYCMK